MLLRDLLHALHPLTQCEMELKVMDVVIEYSDTGVSFGTLDRKPSYRIAFTVRTQDLFSVTLPKELPCVVRLKGTMTDRTSGTSTLLHPDTLVMASNRLIRHPACLNESIQIETSYLEFSCRAMWTSDLTKLGWRCKQTLKGTLRTQLPKQDKSVTFQYRAGQDLDAQCLIVSTFCGSIHWVPFY